MPGSSTTPGPPGARAYAPVCIAFRLRNGVSTPNMNLCGAQWLAYVLLCRRFAAAFAGDRSRLGVERIATPSSYRTWTDYSLPVSRCTESFWTLPEFARSSASMSAQSATRCRNRNASAASLDRSLQRSSPPQGSRISFTREFIAAHARPDRVRSFGATTSARWFSIK